jgi:hypothetical protein
MSDQPDHASRWRLVRDVAVFQIKLGMEAVLNLTLIPVSLAAAALDLVLGNWRQPRWFHAVLGFGERCEHRINVWGVEAHGSDTPQSEVNAIMHSIETLIRRPGTGPDKLREIRRWAATKLAPSDDGDQQPPDRRDDLPS